MSSLYGDHHRSMQEHFETRKLADRLEEVIVKDALDDDDKAFVTTRDMFFLSTVDHQGRPTTSYKGGAPGFVSVVDDRTIAFPSYDGNGMYFSMGNIAGNPNVGILFIDFELPHRMRLQGSASVSRDDELLSRYGGAEMIVRVAIQQTWVNCPRYIHRYRKLEPSRYVPEKSGEAPMPLWKRMDTIQDVLPERDAGRVGAEGGTVTADEYFEKFAKGEA